jgi:DNA-binding PadR family transcriptional regulator
MSYGDASVHTIAELPQEQQNLILVKSLPGGNGLTRAPVAYNIGIMAETLGTFEQAVLLAIVRLGEDAYGRGILRAVQERLNRDVAAGAIHATLERLEGKGLVRSRIGTGTPIRDGRSRRFYRIEPAGVSALNDARATVNHLWRGIRWPLKGSVKLAL